MNQETTELVFILDESGSMFSLKDDTIGGFNSLINKQKNISANCLVSTVLFNDRQKVVYDRIELDNIKPMTRNDYEPSGCTALLDAVGNAIKHIKNIHKYIRREDIPTKTVFIITTDGMENASVIYSYADIKRMINQVKEEFNWEFLFLGANIDAIEAAGEIGISDDRAVNYEVTCDGTKVMYEAVCQTVADLRCEGAIDRNWKSRLNNK